MYNSCEINLEIDIKMVYIYRHLEMSRKAMTIVMGEGKDLCSDCKINLPSLKDITRPGRPFNLHTYSSNH